jgi:hypothetical protein
MPPSSTRCVAPWRLLWTGLIGNAPLGLMPGMDRASHSKAGVSLPFRPHRLLR